MSPTESSTAARKPLFSFYVFILVAALLGTFLLKLRVQGIFACPAEYPAGAYLSNCNAAAYGDYDHGAFWFGLEPEATRAAARAKVIFVGNSRLQFAFSRPDVGRWFARASISYYLLGFSHGETARFTGPVLKKIEPQARVYVVNVDRFFDDVTTPPNEQIHTVKDIRARYEEKKFWQDAHRWVCGNWPTVCGEDVAVFRSREDGTWQTIGARPDLAAQVSQGNATDTEKWPEYAAIARSFLTQLQADPRCVVFTIVPTVDTKRAEAQALAAAVGVPFVSPRLDGLKTFDGSHLEPASADRWSAAFLEAVAPIINACVSGQPPA